jgi:hypothetical protein
LGYGFEGTREPDTVEHQIMKFIVFESLLMSVLVACFAISHRERAAADTRL